jgi:outer membrane biosynthesis protein TonB
MSSAVSELQIAQDIDREGDIITKFSRTNSFDKKLVNISGMSKDGKALVRQTIADERQMRQKNYVLPAQHVIELLTKGSTNDLMQNLSKKEVKMVVKKTPKKKPTKRKTPKKKSTKRKTPKKKSIKKKSVKKVVKKKSAKKVVKKRSAKKKKSFLKKKLEQK